MLQVAHADMLVLSKKALLKRPGSTQPDLASPYHPTHSNNANPSQLAYPPFPTPKFDPSKPQGFDPPRYHLTHPKNDTRTFILATVCDPGRVTYYSPIVALLVYGRHERKKETHTPSLPRRRARNALLSLLLILYHTTSILSPRLHLALE